MCVSQRVCDFVVKMSNSSRRVVENSLTGNYRKTYSNLGFSQLPLLDVFRGKCLPDEEGPRRDKAQAFLRLLCQFVCNSLYSAFGL